MKKVLLFGLAMICASFLMAQSYGDDQIKTVFDDDYPVDHGGYGAITVKYGKILDQDAWFTGIRGGWLINHRFTIGLAGTGLVSRVTHDAWLPDNPSPDVEARLLTGYGGLLLEPIIFHQKQFHVSFPLVIGAGGASYALQSKDFWGDPQWDFYDNYAEPFFALEPGIELEINVLRFMRVNIGGSYLYTSDVRLPDVDPGFMRGFMGSFSLKFGGF